MVFTAIFPDLAGWEPTRDTLHAYSKAVGVVPRTHARPDPRWWHISLKVQPEGLVTERMPLPQGGEFWLAMDLRDHQVLLDTTGDAKWTFSMSAGISPSDLGDQILSALASSLGLTAKIDRQKFTNDDLRPYDPEMAEKYFDTLLEIDRIFKQHRSSLEGEAGPVQIWPHGFDLSFEWFGSRMVESEENGEVKEYPAQLSLGFSPGEPNHPAPYFYSNPWPFENDIFLAKTLPPGARWFTDGWQGSILPYAELVGDSRAEERLLEYARAVYEISRPTLVANR